MKIKDIMTSQPQCVAPNDTLMQAAQILREIDVGVVPVSDGGQLVGMLTDRDIVVRAVSEGRDPKQTTVRETMSQGVTTVWEDQDVEEAARLFEDKQIRRLPVLNREKRLVGILSLGDLAVDGKADLGGRALKEISEPSEPRGRR
jgi:CBS domain-containing protein